MDRGHTHSDAMVLPWCCHGAAMMTTPPHFPIIKPQPPHRGPLPCPALPPAPRTRAVVVAEPKLNFSAAANFESCCDHFWLAKLSSHIERWQRWGDNRALSFLNFKLIFLGKKCYVSLTQTIIIDAAFRKNQCQNWGTLIITH